MRSDRGNHRVRAWSWGKDTFLESYLYAPGPAGSLPRHSHDEYQFGLSLNFPGEYRYLRTSHAVPAGSLSVVHPGEIHSARDPEERRHPATFRMMYVSPELVREAADEAGAAQKALPFFEPVNLDRWLARMFLGMHVGMEEAASGLEHESQLLEVLVAFVVRHADAGGHLAPAGRERKAVREAREYLEDNVAENVSLERLALLTGLSRFRLARVFSKEVGLPPHAYQSQVRVSRAKSLLLRGRPISWVAREVGFADQSHFTRRFKRLVGVTPGLYAGDGKNVQDGGSPR